MTSGERPITGEWDGIFNYPHTLPPTAFAATLREEGGIISGETIEAGDGGTLYGLLQGTRSGAGIAFVKTYDNHHLLPIRYAGTVNDDATEITGRWQIPGEWSGSFLMVRGGAAEHVVGERIDESVER